MNSVRIVMPLLQSVYIEVRQNLHCANVFLQFNMPVVCKNLSLYIDNNCLYVLESETEYCITVPSGCRIARNEFNNLLVDKCNVSFRLSEVCLTEEASASKLYATNGKLPIEQGVTTRISCVNCKCELTEGHVFNRILEFPSDDVNLADFFCHHHSSENESQLLIPKPTDAFFGFGFVVLNSENVVNSRTKGCHLYCQRCLQYLGSTLFKGKAVKLWTDFLWRTTYHANTILVDEPFPKTTTHGLVSKILRESAAHLSSEESFQQIQFSKALVESTFPNRQNKYLCLHFLEKEVPVFCNIANTSCHRAGVNNINHTLHLNHCKSIKLYYRCMEEYNEETTQQENEELRAWKFDITIHNMKISPRLFGIILKELKDNSLMVPHIYRQCDNKLLSCIFY